MRQRPRASMGRATPLRTMSTSSCARSQWSTSTPENNAGLSSRPAVFKNHRHHRKRVKCLLSFYFANCQT